LVVVHRSPEAAGPRRSSRPARSAQSGRLCRSALQPGETPCSAGSSLWLALTVWGSLALGSPSTLGIARTTVPSEHWNSPLRLVGYSSPLQVGRGCTPTSLAAVGPGPP
jgi:hypothetical protein